ncbi:MAG: ATP-binding protein [Bacteroidota bacterium]
MCRKFFLFFLGVSLMGFSQSKEDYYHQLDTTFNYVEQLSTNSKRAVYLKEAYKKLQKLPDDSLKSQYLRKVSNRFYNYGFYDETLPVLFSNLELSTKIKDTLTLGKTHKDLGDYYYRKSKNDSSFYHYQQSLNYLPANTFELIDALIQKATLYKNENHFIEAEKELVQAIRFAKNANKTRQLYDCYLVLGMIQNRLENPDQALENYNKAIGLLSDLKKDSQYILLKAQAYNNRGNVYRAIDEYSNAKSDYEQALTENIEVYSPLLYAAILDNLSYAKLLDGSLKSPDPLFKSLHIRDSIGNKLGQVVSQKRIGEYYLMNQDTTKAISFFNESYQLAKLTNYPRDLLKVLELKAKAQPDLASDFLSEHIRVKDSLLHVERVTREKFAKIELDTDEVISANQRLSERLNYTYLASALLLFILGLAYLLYKQRSKNKLLLMEQEQQQSNQQVYQLLLDQQESVDAARKQEKEVIAAELHDGVISELFGVRLHIEHFFGRLNIDNKEKISPYIKRLNELEDEIRKISHQLKDDSYIHKVGFLEVLNELIKEFKFQSGIQPQVDFDTAINWGDMDNNIKINLFRIVQESLTNIRKYAAATQVELKFIQQKNEFEFYIKDNGKGFDTSKNNEGIGLRNMQSRVKKLGGKLKITSDKNGTLVAVKFPELKN